MQKRMYSQNARHSLSLSLSVLALIASTASLAAATEDPMDDDFLRALIEGGAQGFHLAVDCVSVAPDGSVIEDESELPVGGGRQLDCETTPVNHREAIDTFASDDSRWCALAEFQRAEGHGFLPQLNVAVVNATDGAPARLLGSVDGPEITAHRGAFWPLEVIITYSVQARNVVPKPDSIDCDDVFGL